MPVHRFERAHERAGHSVATARASHVHSTVQLMVETLLATFAVGSVLVDLRRRLSAAPRAAGR